jgi:NAD+ kinase
MSLGGDGTFLRTASMITTNRLPILGINTDPSRSAGALTTRKVDFNRRESDIKKIFTHLDRENFEYFERQRLHFVMKDVYNKQTFEQLSLNEIFCGEKRVSETSMFRIKVDHEDYLGKFKSSGLLVATGTGSTGWLYSAKKYTELDVSRAL